MSERGWPSRLADRGRGRIDPRCPAGRAGCLSLAMARNEGFYELTKPRYSAPTPSFFAIFEISMNVHPILDPDGVDCARDFHTSAGVLRAVIKKHRERAELAMKSGRPKS